MGALGIGAARHRWLALLSLLGGLAVLVGGASLSLPQGAAAQAPDLNGENCLSLAFGPGSITFTNTCRETVKVKFCLQDPYRQPCDAAARFTDTAVDAGRALTLRESSGADVRWFACKSGADFWERPYDPFFDKARRVSFYCVPSAASVAASKAADEEYGPLHAEVWTVREVIAQTPSGRRTCKMAMNHGAFGLDPAGNRFTKTRYAEPGPFKLHWRGGCDSVGWVDGAGKLALQSIDDYEGGVVRHIYTGRAVRGRLMGATSYRRIYGYCDYGQSCDPFTPTSEDELGMQLSLTFVDGCNNWNRSAPSKCRRCRE